MQQNSEDQPEPKDAIEMTAFCENMGEGQVTNAGGTMWVMY
jgi:hypothetical protein